MRGELSFKKPESIEAVIRHPVAAAVGGVVTVLVCAGIGAAAGSPVVTVLMALVGLAIGAPGAAYIADAAARTSDRPA